MALCVGGGRGEGQGLSLEGGGTCALLAPGCDHARFEDLSGILGSRKAQLSAVRLREGVVSIKMSAIACPLVV